MRFIDELANYTDQSTKETSYITHGIHSYPAKFIPILPKEIISACTKERNVVLDPFCGSGTTLLEAALAGRKSIGIDSNPIATLVSKAKTTTLCDKDIAAIRQMLMELEAVDVDSIKRQWIPDAPLLEHWFQDTMITELSWLKSYICTQSEGDLQNFLLCIFSSIIVNVSNQESNTRYVAKDKGHANGYAIRAFARKLSAELPHISELSSIRHVRENKPIVLNADAGSINSNAISDESIDIVITSPPYANSYDYYLYHKWRMIWLGYDYKAVQAMEIGSRHEHSSQGASVATFENRMIPVMKNVSRMLKRNKLAYFFVGDSIISGEFIDMSACFRRIAERADFRFVESAQYSLDAISRSFHEKKSAGQKMQHILVFESVKEPLHGHSIMAQFKSSCTPTDLLHDPIVCGSTISICSDAECNPMHSIGKYPAKFIPVLPQWAILNYSKPGDTVLDPFNGCGTTTTEAVCNGRRAIGIDVSPYACLLASAKNGMISEPALLDAIQDIYCQIDKAAITPQSNRKHFENDLFWFDEEQLCRIEFLREIIITRYQGELQRLLLATLATVIKPCSYLDESQIKVKRDQKKLLKGTANAFDLFIKQLQKLKTLTAHFSDAEDGSHARIICDSVLNLANNVDALSVDLIVTSPPYINAMNYPMNNRYESFLLDLVLPENSIEYQKEFIGTERVYAKDYNHLHQYDTASILGQALNAKLRLIFEKEPKRSYIVYKYFMDMQGAIAQSIRVLKNGGRMVFVVGTNTIKGVQIDTFKILCSLISEMGMCEEIRFQYEIIKNALKISRHKTAAIIKYDSVVVFRKENAE